MTDHLCSMSYILVQCSLKNSTKDETLTLVEGGKLGNPEGSVPAPKSVAPGESSDFTLTPGDEIKYTIQPSGANAIPDRHIKIEFDEDKKAPKLKLGDELEKDDTTVGVETTKTEIK